MVALGSVWFAPRLPDFFQSYPNLNLQLVLTDEDIDFAMREADVAISLIKMIQIPTLFMKSFF